MKSGTLKAGLGIATVMLLAACGGGDDNGGTSAVTFPLAASDNNRHLQDQNGVPFPILGRTAWFITSLSQADYTTFIDDTTAKGYNAIEFHVVNHDSRGNHLRSVLERTVHWRCRLPND